MLLAFFYITYAVCLLALLSKVATAQQVVVAGDIAPRFQTWGFDTGSRCRILAHSDVVLEIGGRRLLILDGGFGSFLTKLNGEQVRVLDLNPYTVAFDLTNDFTTTNLEPLWSFKKPNGTSGPPVTNHGGLWVSADGSAILYQGGHFYDVSSWNSSLYHVEKWQIPAWEVWQMNVTNETSGWYNVTNDTKGHELANRTFAGAAVSVPAAGKSYWLGGLNDPTTAATTPNGTAQTTDQFLIYDHKTGAVTRKKYYLPQSMNGTFQGDLVHLPIGSGSGYLMSLMSLQNPVNEPWTYLDDAGENPANIEPVTWDTIPLWDVDAETWIFQDTSWFKNQIPEPRTRFCTALFHNEVDGTYDLWVHGGQKVSDEDVGVPDIYVLSMPSFIWTKVSTTLANTNLIRSHTCHAVGGQLVIVGGYPPGVKVSTNATCDAEYVKVLKIADDGVSWTGSFVAKSTYRTPKSVRDITSPVKTPYSGFTNQKLQDDFAWRAPNKSRIGGIVGGVVAGVVVLIAVVVAALWLRRRRRARNHTPTPAPEPETSQTPRPPPSRTQTDAIVRRNGPEANLRSQSSTCVSVIQQPLIQHPNQTEDLERKSSDNEVVVQQVENLALGKAF